MCDSSRTLPDAVGVASKADTAALPAIPAPTTTTGKCATNVDPVEAASTALPCCSLRFALRSGVAPPRASNAAVGAQGASSWPAAASGRLTPSRCGGAGAAVEATTARRTRLASRMAARGRAPARARVRFVRGSCDAREQSRAATARLCLIADPDHGPGAALHPVAEENERSDALHGSHCDFEVHVRGGG